MSSDLGLILISNQLRNVDSFSLFKRLMYRKMSTCPSVFFFYYSDFQPLDGSAEPRCGTLYLGTVENRKCMSANFDYGRESCELSRICHEID